MSILKKAPKNTAVYYIRESTEEQDKGFSPDNQERVIKEYARRQGLQLISKYKDLISGTSAGKRSDFMQMMKDAEARKFSHILVYHTSRFARNIKDARGYKEYLREKLGIDVISVTQPFGDWQKPASFLNEGINELFDAYYSKQLSSWVKDALQEKRRQGKPVGNPPLGYFKKQLGYDETKGRPIYEDQWRVNKTEAKVVQNIFQLYATGNHSFADIAVQINKTKQLTKYNNPFTYSSVKDIIRNRAYLGYIYSPRKNYPDIRGSHTPLVAEELFDKAQAVLAERRNTHGRPVAPFRFYLLQGLLYCYHCKDHLTKDNEHTPYAKLLPKMYSERTIKEHREHKSYGCKFAREYRACDQGSVSCNIIDPQVITALHALSEGKEVLRKELKGFLKKQYSNTTQTDKNEPSIQSLSERRERLNTMFQLGELDQDEYQKDILDIKHQIQEYSLTHLSPADKKERIETKTHEYSEILDLFTKQWKPDTIQETRRQWIQQLLKRIWIENKRVIAIEPQDGFLELFSLVRKVMGQPPLATPLDFFFYYSKFCLDSRLSSTPCLAP